MGFFDKIQKKVQDALQNATPESLIKSVQGKIQGAMPTGMLNRMQGMSNGCFNNGLDISLATIRVSSPFSAKQRSQP